MEYLQQLKDSEGITTSIVLDGRKVRIGFEGSKIDPMLDKYREQAETLHSMSVKKD
jgi:hypothetical protein